MSELKSTSDNVLSSPFLIKVSESPLTLEECHSFVSLPSCGAISSFVGVTRDNFEDKKVAKLSYEGYVSMAERKLRELCEAANERYDIARIAVTHILGDCAVGKASVVIVVSSTHRKDSLDCVSWLIDELKANVPIWKKEIYEGDECSVWKENVEWKDGEKKRIMVKRE